MATPTNNNTTTRVTTPTNVPQGVAWNGRANYGVKPDARVTVPTPPTFSPAPYFVPGYDTINTLQQFMPNNYMSRKPSLFNGEEMNNGIPTMPLTLNAGFVKRQEELIALAENFEESVYVVRQYNYRQVYELHVLPLNKGSLAQQFAKVTDMDDNPGTASVQGLLNSWLPVWNEVSISASSVEITTNAYGRYYKQHSYTNDLTIYDWAAQLARAFAPNAARTLNKLAGYRLWHGANKLLVKQVTPTPVNGNVVTDPRIELAETVYEVTAPLSMETLLEARYQMENYVAQYTTVRVAPETVTITGADGTATTQTFPAGTLKNDNEKLAVIPTYRNSGHYLVLLSHSGYRQVMSDPYFRDAFSRYGGYLASSFVNENTGISSPVFMLKFEKCDQPITLKKGPTPAEGETGTYTVNTDGMGDLHVAFVIGGSKGVGFEVQLEGSTRMIYVGKDEDKKVDPFSTLSLVGWVTVTDFGVVFNEGLWAIPHKADGSLLTAASREILAKQKAKDKIDWRA